MVVASAKIKPIMVPSFQFHLESSLTICFNLVERERTERGREGETTNKCTLTAPEADYHSVGNFGAVGTPD